MINKLLLSLPADDLAAIQTSLAPDEIAAGTMLELPGRSVSHAHFVEQGLLSVVMRVGEDSSELGLVGPEGMVGVPATLGTEVAPYAVIARTDVSTLRVSTPEFRRLMRERPSIGALVIRYIQAQIAQLAHNAFANGQLNTTRRLARWLLMAHDRIEGDHLRISHSAVSTALGAHRPGVTVALHELEGERAIRSRRNSLTIVDRAQLAAIAGPAYGPAEAAYAMLFGRPLGNKPS